MQRSFKNRASQSLYHQAREYKAYDLPFEEAVNAIITYCWDHGLDIRIKDIRREIEDAYRQDCNIPTIKIVME